MLGCKRMDVAAKGTRMTPAATLKTAAFARRALTPKTPHPTPVHGAQYETRIESRQEHQPSSWRPP